MPASGVVGRPLDDFEAGGGQTGDRRVEGSRVDGLEPDVGRVVRRTALDDDALGLVVVAPGHGAIGGLSGHEADRRRRRTDVSAAGFRDLDAEVGELDPVLHACSSGSGGRAAAVDAEPT